MDGRDVISFDECLGTLDFFIVHTVADQAIDLEGHFLLELLASHTGVRGNVHDEQVAGLRQIVGECLHFRGHLSIAHEPSMQSTALSQSQDGRADTGGVIRVAAEHGRAKGEKEPG